VYGVNDQNRIKMWRRLSLSAFQRHIFGGDKASWRRGGKNKASGVAAGTPYIARAKHNAHHRSSFGGTLYA